MKTARMERSRMKERDNKRNKGKKQENKTDGACFTMEMVEWGKSDGERRAMEKAGQKDDKRREREENGDESGNIALSVLVDRSYCIT